MEVKKNKKYDLERRRPIFFGIGMIISLSLAITAFEWRTEVEPICILEMEVEDWIQFVPPPSIHTPPPPPPPKAVVPVEVENDKEEDEQPIIDVTPADDIPIVVVIPEPIEEPVDETPRSYAEVMPTFEGGMEKFYQFMGKNMKYPKSAQKIGIEGRVFLQFIVGKDGTITDLKVVKGIGAGCDEEALRVMSLIPKFKPGKQGDVRVPVKMIIPINFTLQ